MAYDILFKKSAAKSLLKLDPKLARRLEPGIMALAANPRPHGSKKLVGITNAYRIRIGDFRILFEIFDDIQVVNILTIAHRKDVYRP